MKTLDEVIKAFEVCMKPVSEFENCIGCPYADETGEPICCGDDKEDALHYLKEYQTILPLVPSLINTAIAVQKKGKTIG